MDNFYCLVLFQNYGVEVVGYGQMVKDDDKQNLTIKAAGLNVGQNEGCKLIYDWKSKQKAGLRRLAQKLKNFVPDGFADSMICASNAYK